MEKTQEEYREMYQHEKAEHDRTKEKLRVALEENDELERELKRQTKKAQDKG